MLRMAECSGEEMASELGRGSWRDARNLRRESVKSTSPTTENWLRKLCTYSMNNNTSDEDKHDTNYINNKYTNTYTRKLHNF